MARGHAAGAPMIGVSILLAALAGAQDDESWVTPSGEWRLIASRLSDFPIDADGTTTGQGMWLDHRLRTGATLQPSALWTGRFEVDLADGSLAGDRWTLTGTPDERYRDRHVAYDIDGVIGRRASVQTVIGDTQVELGLVTSSWGLGMVANDGASDPMFGRSDFGDRVLRLRGTYMPSSGGPPPPVSLLLTGAVDLVVADDVARLRDGQQALQVILSALAIGREGDRLGTYLVGRYQDEADPGRRTQAFVLDLYGQTRRALSSSAVLEAGFEVAGIAGETNRATTYESPGSLTVASLGATTQTALWFLDERLGLHLNTGYASGDGNPDDSRSQDFTFDRDFGVGMVLFDEVMYGIEAGSWALLTDPENAGQPPDGVDTLVTEGAFRRAVFLQPAIVAEPHEWIELKGGFVWAWSTAYYAHPFYSFRAGGVPTNHTDQPVEDRLLGGEVNWSVALRRHAEVDGLGYGLWLQGGHLGVGPALRGGGMPANVHLVTATGRITW